jgi:hypothetical protein
MNTFFLRTAGSVLLAIGTASSASAQDRVFTGKELVSLCKSGDAQRQSACSGFITGVRHTLDVFKNSLKDRVSYCIPRTVNNRDFRDGFVAWAERNPAELEHAAVRGVIKSALARYNCAGTAPKPFEF